MSESTPVATAAYTPAGFCPRCGFRTDPGVCSDCGRVNRRVTRHDPTTRFRRWLRVAAISSLLAGSLAAAGIGCVMAVYRWVPSQLQLHEWSRQSPRWRAQAALSILNFRFERRQRALDALSARITADAPAALTEHDLAGNYIECGLARMYLGSSTTVQLGRDGEFVERLDGCLGHSYTGAGTYRLLHPDLIVCTDTWDSQMAPRRFVRCRVGGRPVIVEEEHLSDLLNAPVGEGWPLMSCYAREDALFDLPIEKFTLPPVEVSDRYQYLSLGKELTARVVNVRSSVSAAVASHDPRTDVELDLDVGTNDGVFVGLGFWWDETNVREGYRWSAAVRVREVSVSTCRVQGVIRGRGSFDDPQPAPGMRLKSGRFHR